MDEVIYARVEEFGCGFIIPGGCVRWVKVVDGGCNVVGMGGLRVKMRVLLGCRLGASSD